MTDFKPIFSLDALAPGLPVGLDTKKASAQAWFAQLRDQIVGAF